MATNPNSPLTDAHLQQLNAALRAAQVAESQIQLAKQAGIDVSGHEQQLAQAVAKIRAIKAAYFPGQ